MLKKIGTSLAIASTLALAPGIANAISFDLSGGSAITPGTTNNILENGFELQNMADLNLNGSSSQKVELEFFFVGSESGYTNEFKFGSDISYTEYDPPQIPANSPISFGKTTVNGDDDMSLLSFLVNGNTVQETDSGYRTIAFAFLDLAAAGCNGDDLNGSKLSVNCLSASPTSTVLVALDDGGAGPDDNHDDWVGYIKATVVPLPAAVWLFGSFLLGLAGFGRFVRKR